MSNDHSPGTMIRDSAGFACTFDDAPQLRTISPVQQTILYNSTPSIAQFNSTAPNARSYRVNK